MNNHFTGLILHSIIIATACHLTLQQFLQAVSHDVDVFNPLEVESDIGIVVLILVAFSCRTVCHCIQLTNTKDFCKCAHTHMVAGSVEGQLKSRFIVTAF